MMNNPYLYKLTQKSTGKWYVGSRTAKKCKPDEGYICSSKHVKHLFLENPSDWVRTILVLGPADYIRELEAKYLIALNAKNDVMSYNLHNGDGKFTTAGKKLLKRDMSHLFTQENILKKSIGNKKAWAAGLYANRKKMLGDKNPSKRLDVRKRISEALTGLAGGRMTGKKHSEETRAKMSASRSAYWAKKKLRGA